MSLQYICRTPNRREKVRLHPILNGIDFLQVLDLDAVSILSPRQRTVLVHLLKTAPPLDATAFQIAGGVRITPIHVLFVARADNATQFTTKERAFLAALPQADHIVAVRTDAAGDFSTYTLTITAPPEANLDPHLSSVDFSFKVECPSDFDCATTSTCPPSAATEPLIDYLAKDYASFRRLMLDRMATTMPAWQERNPADLGVALVEVLAYAADFLSYYQDAVATEAYLGTARKRVSIRRHARLLDYRMHDGCNARAWVCFEVGAGTGADGARLNAGAQLLTRAGEDPGAISSGFAANAVQQGARTFETMYAVTLHAAHNEIALYTWSDAECCLPKGATRATLDNTASYGRPTLQLQVGDVLILEEKLGSATGIPADADPTHRQAVRLISVTPGFDPLNNTPVVDIEWGSGDALAFPLCISTTVRSLDGSKLVSNISVARGNVVLADDGISIGAESLAEVPPTGLYRPTLAEKNVTQLVRFDPTHAASQSAAAALTQDPRAALPSMTLDENGTPWMPVADLLESGRFAREFVLEIETDGSATLRFGDGVLGRKPLDGMTATYRTGNGSAGNVGAEAISHVIWNIGGVLNVRNPLPAQGGTDPETATQVCNYAPQAFRTQQRAVTTADYATVAQSFPGVARAQATLRWTGSWYTMFVTVDRRGGFTVDPPFQTSLRGYLERFRLAGYDLEIEAPVFVPLDIAFTVCVAPGFFRSDVEYRLTQVFSSGVLPGGALGFFHPDNFTFGQTVYLSQIVAAAMQTPGVLWVDTDDAPPKPNYFRRWGQRSRGETTAGRITFDRLEIARLDNDPNAPENGRMGFVLKGGI